MATDDEFDPSEVAEAAGADPPVRRGQRRANPTSRRAGIPETLEQAIAASLPSRYMRPFEMPFPFCRALRGMKRYAGLDPLDLWDEFAAWWSEAQARIDGQASQAELWDYFCKGWSKVKSPVGGRDEADVVAKAKQRPPLDVLARYGDDQAIHLLAAICAEKQARAGDESFEMSAGKAGELIGASKSTGHALLSTLARHQVIQREWTAPAKRGSRGSQWRYIHEADERAEEPEVEGAANQQPPPGDEPLSQPLPEATAHTPSTNGEPPADITRETATSELPKDRKPEFRREWEEAEARTRAFDQAVEDSKEMPF